MYCVDIEYKKDMIMFWIVHRRAKMINSAASLAEIRKPSWLEPPVPASSGGHMLLPKQAKEAKNVLLPAVCYRLACI